MSRLLFICLGLICVGLGALGAALPLLPTTPFVLLGAYCFARSSPRLHAWLLSHRVFGPLIRDWKAHRSIAPGAKLSAVLAMIATIGLSVVLALSPTILVIQGVVLSAVATFILTRPNPPQEQEHTSTPLAAGDH